MGVYAQIVTYTLMLVIPIIVVTYCGEGIQAAFEYKLGMRTKKSCIKKTAKYAPLLSDWCLNTSEVQAKREAERKEREYQSWLMRGGWRYASKRTVKQREF